MFVRVTIDARRSCGVAIPRSAIDHATVQVVKGNTIETRQVKVGLSSDVATEILEGVREGESVVADAGTSQIELARLFGLHASTVCQMLQRRRDECAREAMWVAAE